MECIRKVWGKRAIPGCRWCSNIKSTPRSNLLPVIGGMIGPIEFDTAPIVLSMIRCRRFTPGSIRRHSTLGDSTQCCSLFIKAKAGDLEQLQARRETSLWLCSHFHLGNHKKRDKQLKSQIKLIKRSREIVPTDRTAPSESKSVEPSAREITSVIKNWIADFKERKHSQKQFSSLFTLSSQVKSTS